MSSVPVPIESYALLSNCRSAALVSDEGSIDWLCLPRYDSGSIFAALLGDRTHGRWSLRPTDPAATATRRYDGDTFVLVTRWECATGVAEVHEFMPVDDGVEAVVRRVVGVSGEVGFASELRLRFDYARAVPWVRQLAPLATASDGELPTGVLLAVAGPDAVTIRGPRMTAADTRHRAEWSVTAGRIVDSVLRWEPSYRDIPRPFDVDVAIERARTWWSSWARRIDRAGRWGDRVLRSLLVLRALTHAETGGIVAAATTSLPEELGGTRNWDYRYVWLRDAALTLEAYIAHGYLEAAVRWRDWLLRAVAGDPADVQIMYGIAGERDLPERELANLPGYAGSAPVRIGNGAVDQYQADVIGEVMVALEAARLGGVAETGFSWALQRALLDQVVAEIDRPDHGIWEMRGEPQRFTHSRVMVWAALDRGVRAVEEHGLDGDVETWRRLREGVRAEIDEHGVDAAGGHFTQYAGTDEVDASLLLLPAVGFCRADDPRMLATVARIEQTLLRDGLVLRYRTEAGADGLPGGEHPFLACSFWLVEQYAATGRTADATDLMDRLCAIANDVGLLSEEYDVTAGSHRGNTPQALSHLALVGAADALAGHAGRAAHRH
ncbi:glycoside hydrolase family 15 protein [Microbacterium oleivorans]|uniref:Glycoside hydrolase family 15 protein n=1 Tax=Microbacterium oleivorans TaxID=273677 RepID=A0A7D5JY63_9MICO|nr:glycoside hydrolase family 15 protein [Microbacterium oleivorans]QLD11583.1 glycoside hydrolase family 15 protein [Microbacterium oleivorans]